jgi:uncharacterized protein (TIGR02217 family)
MSNAVFPVLPGLMWDVTRTPEFATKIQRASSGKETRIAYMTAPIWRWVLKYDVLRQNTVTTELSQLLGFFNARRGKFDSFLYTDPIDNAVVAAQIGVGDGATTVFQLTRAFGGFTENVYDLNGAASIYKNGVLQASGYSVSATGLLTFTAAPAAGVVITWTGSYYWRVRFDQDMAEANNFLVGLWDMKQLAFVSVL